MQTIQLNRLKTKPGQRLLDLGCGEGRHAIAACLNHDLDIFYLDINPADLAKARNNFTDFFDGANVSALPICGSGLKLPFENHSFDHVVCSEVLEHVHELDTFIAEIERVLKPGASLAVSVPRYWPEKFCWWLSDAYHQVEGGHIRIFTEATLKKLFKQSYQIKGRHWAHALHAPYWWLRCAFWQSGDSQMLVRFYHKFLVWDLLQKPRITRIIERILNPLMGKSLVLYFVKR